MDSRGASRAKTGKATATSAHTWESERCRSPAAPDSIERSVRPPLRSEVQTGERPHEPDDPGPQENDEHRGEDAEDQREQQLDRDLLGLLLGPLPALHPQLL